MTALLADITLFLQDTGSGRGDNPSDAGGVLIIVGIIVLALLVASTLVYTIMRVVRSRRRPGETAEDAQRPLPSEQGRPWSSER